MVTDLVRSGVTVLWSTAYLEEAERCAHIWLSIGGSSSIRGRQAT